MLKTVRVACAALSLLLPVTAAALADEPIKMRVSLDTSASHPRTVSVTEYLKAVEAASNGRIKTEMFHSAQLYRDRDVAKALRQGNIEMAVPGSWVLSGFVPDADFFMLPSMAGQSADLVHKIVDGKVGEIVNGELEKKLEVKVLGKWTDLGYNNEYSTSKPLNTFPDLQGLKLRNAGGAGLSLRAKFYGAIPNTTAWPDVPLALSQGTFDAFTSSDESVASAKLWDSGVKHEFTDHAYFAMYIPLISQSFYNKLPPDLQKIVVDTWVNNIDKYREAAAAAQTHGRQEDQEHGIHFVDPSAQELAAERQKLVTTESDVAKELHISDDVLKALHAELPSGS